ncbi:hypothetical protein YC2023_115450 [Brassica napus]
MATLYTLLADLKAGRCSNTAEKYQLRLEIPCDCIINALVELTYWVILSVSDNTGTAAFLGFDMEVAKLTHVLASEAPQIVIRPIINL